MSSNGSLNPFLNPFFDDVAAELEAQAAAAAGQAPPVGLDIPLPSSSSSYASSDAGSFFEPPPPPPAAFPLHAPPPHVVLPPFRASRPAAWFGQVENIFRLRRVTDQRDQFGYAIAVLGEDQTLAIDDLLEQFPPPVDAFRRLKERLLAHHSLDTFQRVEQLMDIGPLGGLRPSVLLAQMRQLLPPGEENTVLFRCLFLRRLPREIRLALAEDRFSPVAALAARADSMIVHHDPAVAAAVAAASPVDDPAVAAVTAGGRPAQQPKKSGRRGGGRDRRQAAKQRVGVCYSHWKYGEDAYHCDQPGACAFKAEN
jgi:hypothetical protein